MTMIGPAAAAEDLQRGQSSHQSLISPCEIFGITVVENFGGV
jgi:hypothetical protein